MIDEVRAGHDVLRSLFSLERRPRIYAENTMFPCSRLFLTVKFPQIITANMSLPKTFSLRAADGKTIQIPSVGYGTWASGDNSWAKDATLTALKEGYRHLDCAWMYGVDEAVGQAIKESGVPREEIFVTTKVRSIPARSGGQRADSVT